MLSDLEDVLTDLYDRKPKPYTILTGLRGMASMSMHIHLGALKRNPVISSDWVNRNRDFEKSFMYLSLFDKGGLWKIRYYENRKGDYKWELWHGTNLVSKSTSCKFLETLNLGMGIHRVHHKAKRQYFKK